ncbi:MAG: zinc-ribbon domain-containing protein [Oscillospiraceae bacterium]|jgi:uncharacterized membrane protein|nr:zinc-ribbon domain-containing protein [Oscillospiraceae bacterium]
MFCSNCGNQVAENALSCPYCGFAMQSPPRNDQPYYQQTYQQNDQQPYRQPAQGKIGTNLFCLLGLIFTIVPIVPFAGLILCIIGLSDAKKKNEGGRGLAIAGIVIALISVVIGIIVMLFVVGSAFFFADDFAHYADPYLKDYIAFI